MFLQWEAFSIPELENFVRMLDKEEEEYVEQVRAKYKLMKIHMSRRMAEIQPEEQKDASNNTDTANSASKESKREPVFV